MTIEHIINNNFKNLDWDSTSEAYYTLDFTPFMEVIYDSVKEYAEKQKELCADNAIAEYTSDIEVHVVKESILQCPNAINR